MTSIITADLHLNDNQRDEYRWGTCEAIIRYSQKVKATAVFICGDLTDDKDNHSAALVNRIVDLLPRFAPRVFIIRGNHDCIDPNKPFFKFVDKIKGLTFVNEPLTWNTGDSWVVMVPNGMFNVKLIDADETTLVLCHETFDGATVGRFNLTGPTPPKTDVPIISGDVHVPQQVGSVTYVGAPTLIDFGDDWQPRILKLDDVGKLTSVNINTPTKRLIHVTPERKKLFWPKAGYRKGDIVKVRITLGEAVTPEMIEAYRAEATKWARGHDLNLYGIEFEVPKGSLPQERHEPKPDKELAISYGKSHGYDAPTVKVGVDIVERKLLRYWYHPESDSLFTTQGDDDPKDPLCEEISEAAYNKGLALLNEQKEGSK